MNKKHSGLIVILTLAMLLISGCKMDELPSNWASEPIVIDGQMTDWNSIRGHHFPDQGVSIALSNDHDQLYLHFRTADPKWARIIKRTGLTIYLNAQGKKRKDFYIKLKDGPTNKQLSQFQKRAGSDETNYPRRGGRSSQMSDEPSLLTCYVKDRIIEKPIPFDGSEGPSAAFDTSLGFFSYEFAIPLAKSTVRHYGFAAEVGQTISLGFMWGDMGAMERPGGGGSMGGGAAVEVAAVAKEAEAWVVAWGAAVVVAAADATDRRCPKNRRSGLRQHWPCHPIRWNNLNQTKTA